MKRFDKHFHSKERVLFIQSLPCIVCGLTPSQNAHVKSRGAGGTYLDIVPLCYKHHLEQGQIGITTFAGKYYLDLDWLAEETERQWNEKF